MYICCMYNDVFGDRAAIPQIPGGYIPSHVLPVNSWHACGTSIYLQLTQGISLQLPLPRLFGTPIANSIRVGPFDR